MFFSFNSVSLPHSTLIMIQFLKRRKAIKIADFNALSKKMHILKRRYIVIKMKGENFKVKNGIIIISVIFAAN